MESDRTTAAGWHRAVATVERRGQRQREDYGTRCSFRLFQRRIGRFGGQLDLYGGREGAHVWRRPYAAISGAGCGSSLVEPGVAHCLGDRGAVGTESYLFTGS